MNIKGVSYDVGRVMGGNWRPVFDPRIVHRELEIIKNDLHCNTVRICGFDIDRLMVATEDALKQGLEVWLSPEMWDKSSDRTLDYIGQAATAAEGLRAAYSSRLVLVAGSELTLFMKGIIPGRTFGQRLKNAFSAESPVRRGDHNRPLNEFLAKVVQDVRKNFHGKLSYASLIWEKVDWSLFDFVGVDHYRDNRIKDKYADLLKPLFAYDKPVVITEFGMRTYEGAENSGTVGIGITNHLSLFLHQIPMMGRFIRPRLKGDYVRNEDLPAREDEETLKVLDDAGVNGAFVMTFTSPLFSYDENPRYDLDMDSFALVKSFRNGKYGTTYPDMPWEPKKAFQAIGNYYAKN